MSAKKSSFLTPSLSLKKLFWVIIFNLSTKFYFDFQGVIIKYKHTHTCAHESKRGGHKYTHTSKLIIILDESPVITRAWENVDMDDELRN